ncbi:DUF4870 domain-containing protein [Terriglobus sp.]|uniref:DUF4870 domain-containing protein n=1 Tax=Terriglobus sp. TaxID=1889013 RepID=UPI003AFF8096
MRYRFTEPSFAASPVLMATPGGYPPPGPGYQAPPPGYVPPPAGQPGGLSATTASVLAYLFGFISGIIFLVLEPYKRDSFVRFNAFQSIFFNLSVFVISFLWNLIAGLLDVMTHGVFVMIHLAGSLLIGIGFLVIWIMLMVRASQGSKWVLPVIGPFAERQAASGSF